MLIISALVFFFIIRSSCAASIKKIENFTAHYGPIFPVNEEKLIPLEKNYWLEQGASHLKTVLKETENEPYHIAKNVIIFIADGMGATTATATRIYKGQRYFNKIGEEHQLSFEKFLNVALAKTYNVDRQVPDSAGTATAMFTGVKTRMKSIGLDVKSDVFNFDSQVYEKSKLNSFMVWAQEAEKDTGIVTTTRITHATPAATYARINNRDWECDTEIPTLHKSELKDIARQLVEDEPGKNFKVILGGGQQQMGYVSFVEEGKCSRGDDLNLTQKWLELHNKSNTIFAVNNADLELVNEDTEYLLGLFSPNHMPFESTRNNSPTGTPSLTQMTKKALNILKKNSNGFLLMVEGGLIDQAHHKNYARMALSETAEFDNAIALALNETGPDTLIIVTSDHSHSFTMNGYAKRGNDILGFGNETADEAFKYLTLSYGNGPGFDYHYSPNNTQNRNFPWRDVVMDNNRLQDPWYQHLGSFTREDETHGGEDVPVYATGPGSYLIKGVFEQNYIAHVVSYSSCIGPYSDLNLHCKKVQNSRGYVTKSGILIFISTFLAYYLA